MFKRALSLLRPAAPLSEPAESVAPVALAEPSLPLSLEALYATMAPYHQQKRWLDLFFEFLVLDVVGQLPAATQESISALIAKHPVFFADTEGDWRRGTRKALHLSETIDIAILDLWFGKSAEASAEGWRYHPWSFAKDFYQQYLADGSRVDVWEGDAFELAKARIAAAQAVSGH
jgi:hypothetical protein